MDTGSRSPSFVNPSASVATGAVLLLAALAGLITDHTLSAQIPGSAGADRVGEQSSAEAAMGGTILSLQPGASSLFGNPARLGDLPGNSVSLSWHRHSGLERSFNAAAAFALDGRSGVGAALSFSGVSPIEYRNSNEQVIGSGSSGTLVISTGGSIGIGPGAIGGALRLLSYSARDLESGQLGVAVDLGGSLRLRNRLHFSLLLRNLGGVLNATYRDGLHESVPVDSRVGIAYAHPLRTSFDTIRRSPTGVVRQSERTPDRYILGGLELRSAPFEEEFILGGSIEAMPFTAEGLPGLGFRAGANTRGEIGGGVFLDVDLDGFLRSSRVSFGYRHAPVSVADALFFSLELAP